MPNWGDIGAVDASLAPVAHVTGTAYSNMDRRRAQLLSAGAFGLGVVVLWLTVDGGLGPVAGVGALACFVAAGYARSVQSARAGVVLAGGVVVALGTVGLAATLAPLSNVPLPDVGVLGPYTYLATEFVFGSLALGLLLRAGRGSLRRAARTIAVVYPLAYVWDWYTLEVGVFAIPLRTGVELVGIPLEEHLFMVVVPALVLGIHETLDERTEHP